MRTRTHLRLQVARLPEGVELLTEEPAASQAREHGPDKWSAGDASAVVREQAPAYCRCCGQLLR